MKQGDLGQRRKELQILILGLGLNLVRRVIQAYHSETEAIHSTWLTIWCRKEKQRNNCRPGELMTDLPGLRKCTKS